MTWLWLVSAASLIATWLNIHHRPACFAIWVATNVVWCVVDLGAGIPEQAALHFVYTVLALWGLCAWTRNDHRRGAAST